GYEGVTATFLPHMNFGDSECCGTLYGVVVGGSGLVGCNECGGVGGDMPGGRTLGHAHGGGTSARNLHGAMPTLTKREFDRGFLQDVRLHLQKLWGIGEASLRCEH